MITRGLEWISVLLACLGLAIVASSCAHCSKDPIKPPCVSRCGMLLEDEGNGSMSCDDLQEAEDRLLEASDELKDKDARLEKQYACGQLFGWQLRLHEEVIGVDWSVGPMPFVGLANCDTKEMHLMANQSWRKGSYPHEFFHAVQECKPPEDWVGVDNEKYSGPGHRGWHDHGVGDVIDDFRAGRR